MTALSARLPATQPEERVLPFNVEVEMALIGSVMLNNDVFMRVSNIVQVDHFHEEMHQAIWSTIAALITKGQVANPILLKTYLGNPELAPGKTLIAYLSGLVTGSTGYANAESYARTIRDLYLRRQFVTLSERLASIAYEAPVDATAETIFADVERDLEALRPAVQKDDDGWMDFGRVESDDVYDAYQREAGVVGLSTGLQRLDDVLGGLQNSDLIILAGRPAMGKAQPLDAQVLTASGWRPMGQIKVGDELASPDGRPSKVEGVIPQGERQIWRVTLSDGRSTECCDEHLWRVHYRDWKGPRILQTADIRRMLGFARYRGRIWIDEVTGDFGDDAGVTVDPWLLGALLGDGTLRGTLRFSTVEPEILSEVVRAAGPEMHATFAGHNTYRIVRRLGAHVAGVQGVSPNPIVEKLKALGVWGLDSSTKFIPAAYLNGSRETRLNILRGLMDTDGWAESHGSVRFSSASRALAEGVRDLVRSLGGTCSIVTKATTFTRDGISAAGQQAFFCRIRYVSAETFFRSQRKASRAVRGRNATVRLTFRSIEPTRVAQAQCIKVSHPDSLYVTDDYVVTHNTALATNIGVAVARHVRARRAAGENLGPVGIFSLEMSRKQLKNRIVADMANVSARKLLRGEGAQEEMTAFNDADRDLADLPLTIDHTGALPIASIKMRARALKKRRGLSLLIVDYLQLITGSEKRGREHNRTQEVTEISAGLKALAKELDVPIIALSQLSRKVEERDDKRPMLADLRESGSIEQDADSVIFVYREEYYLRKNKPRDEGEALGNWYAKMKRWENVAEAIVAKNRHGPEESVELGFEGEFTRFSNEPPWRPADPEEARSKRVKLTDHAVELRAILRELTNVVANRPTQQDLIEKKGLPPNAMLIPREDVRREFFTRVVPDLPEAEQRRKVQAAGDNLRNNKLTEAFRDASGRDVIYLVELLTE